MTAIYSYGEWIDITARGTSGDQVSDILASWQADAYKWLETNDSLIAQRAQLVEVGAELLALEARLNKWYTANMEPMWWDDLTAVIENARAAIAASSEAPQ